MGKGTNFFETKEKKTGEIESKVTKTAAVFSGKQMKKKKKKIGTSGSRVDKEVLFYAPEEIGCFKSVKPPQKDSAVFLRWKWIQRNCFQNAVIF